MSSFTPDEFKEGETVVYRSIRPGCPDNVRNGEAARVMEIVTEIPHTDLFPMRTSYRIRFASDQRETWVRIDEIKKVPLS
jgi:hypothetical protein